MEDKKGEFYLRKYKKPEEHRFLFRPPKELFRAFEKYCKEELNGMSVNEALVKLMEKEIGWKPPHQE